eukprot:TRINITY_DN451_c0_g1_i1.p1 TRINITY_DN451_c0_g1~~TRINITY_DN451_c0_g1_i1.p1  ORF type:complete len:732 (-),score=221.14 TRINITY_DN451_c0_g1_i1:34-2229(-)
MDTIKKAIHSAQEKVEQMTTAMTQDAKAKDLENFAVTDAKPGHIMSTNFGTRITHDEDSTKVGERGPTLLEDFHFREKMTHFDHERIPERVVHARGSAAHGHFQVYESLADYTTAQFLCDPTLKTPVFVRFSTVLGSRGSADTVRDVRGFATKFYTPEGNFDLVGNNIPVFFIQDALKFPDIIHSGKPMPHNEVPQAQTAHDNFWDFISLSPETSHMVLWTLSDRAIPRSYRMMQGFGVHSFLLVNAQGKRRFVKFHWLPSLGTHSLVWDEAQKLVGTDPDWHRRDLWDAIESGAYPEWELGLQVVDEDDEHKFDFDLLDATKIIPEELVPVRRVGKMVLNRNPDNFFCETEQVAFCTQHLVPGIEASNDPLLQGRMFSYQDTQLTRLGGPNFQEIPINRPVCPVFNNQRDGFHRMTINRGTVNYSPNRFGCPAAAKINEGYAPSRVHIQGDKVRAKGPKFGEHFNQAIMFFNSLSSWEKQHLIDAAIFELGHVDDMGVRERMIERLNHIDFNLACKVALGIGVEPPKSFAGQIYEKKSPAVSQSITVKDSIKSRRIAYIVGPGFNSAQLTAIQTAMAGLGAVNFVVGPNKGPIIGNDGTKTVAQFGFTMTKSVMFDALVIVGGKGSIDAMQNIGNAKAFIVEAYKHCKPIAAIDEAVDLVQKLFMQQMINVKFANENSGVVRDLGVVTIKNFAESALAINKDGPVTFGSELFNSIAVHRHYERETEHIAA